MSKLPYMQFFPADWLRDTRCLSPVARGVWIDLICFLHDCEPRGSATLTLRAWASKLVVTQEVFLEAVKELVEMGVCNSVTVGHGSVTIESRRILREEKRRISDRIRKQRERGHEPVTPQSRDGHGDIHIQKHIQSHNQSHIQKKKENKSSEGVTHRLEDRSSTGFTGIGGVVEEVLKHAPTWKKEIP